MQSVPPKCVPLLCCYIYILATGVQITRSDDPHFTSKAETFRVVAGDSLLLPCAVDNLGTYALLWRRETLVLTANELKITRNPRMSLHDGFNLRITNVTSLDAGEYVCQIAGEVAMNQIHNVQVLLPPIIHSSVPNGQLTTKRGGNITLTCTASGNPMPSILWTRKGSPLLIKEGFSMSLEKVDRHHSGVYQCSASNGVGLPVSVDLRLDVLHSPEVEVETPWVYTEEGASVKLICDVHGLPIPKVRWYQGMAQLTVQGRYTLGSEGHRHWLNIDDVQTADFTNYTCTAENSLGKASGTVQLQGKPGRCVRLSSLYSHTSHSYNLSWTVDSFSPLEEVKLIYRRILINDSVHEMGQWEQETIPLVMTNYSALTYHLWYDIKDLEESSVFQVQVQVRNRYGWSDLSDVYQFYTRGSVDHSKEYNMGLLTARAGCPHIFVFLLFMSSFLMII